ncbi:hypothetical protein [Nocardia sp. NPDC051570]|uniref:hypothetical protein n=1 Tax=Nocardia sp. NPDC051570 TaxID=3364324 RepID=UPI003794BD33
MGSADEAKRDESERPDPEVQDQAGSAFGPPVSEFGPPVTGFGPPLNDFGPPTSAGPVGWTPADAPERPTLGWQPADAPPAPQPPAPQPPQYRAPDSSTPLPPSPAPEQRRPPGRPSDTAAEDRIPESEAWWQSTQSGYPPTPPKQSQAAARPSTGSGSTGSLWDDDELARKLVASRPTPAEPEAPERAERGRGPIIIGAVAALAVIVAVVLVIVFVSRGHGKDETVVQGPPASNTATSAMNCPAGSTGNVTTGNGVGDTDSGAGAILGFQHAFYVDRNGAKVRTFVAPDTDRVPAADDIQHAIDANIPQGTRFCLRIEQLASDRYTTELTEFRPDGGKTLYRQLVTTVNQGGKNLVWGIVSI